MQLDLGDLVSCPAADYGPEWKAHALAQYEIAVEMADRISQRRTVAHGMFLSGNSILITVAAAGFSLLLDNRLFVAFGMLVICVVGISLCFYWRKLIIHYRQLNSGKYTVLCMMEKSLPLAPYGAEWIALGQGKDPALYTPLTRTETKLPVVFMFFYMALAAAAVLLAVLH